MKNNKKQSAAPSANNSRKHLAAKIYKYRGFYLMFLPVFIFAAIFFYLPMIGIRYAFTDYNGIKDATFTGLANFEKMFSMPNFWSAFVNTLQISIIKLFLTVVVAVVISIFLNEIANIHFKKVVQTIAYMPHFLSWVVIAGIWISMLSVSGGAVNQIMGWFGLDAVDFMTNKGTIRWVLFFSEGWRSLGWDSIVYFTAILAISPDLYEAATVDGAKRIDIIRYIILPALVVPMTTMFILNLGFFMTAGFDQVFNFTNQSVNSVIDILDTYVYRIGLESGQYSLATAVALIKGIVGVFLVLVTHLVSKKVTGKGVW